ncbi:phosphatidylglycerophosphatase A family protein [Desulfolucanica intricata]|uniref:phosphatidylglycerophosphatase A family protein n=1 Tax=Desulfolucanica intricata TaxID=1285191 RepID=UPI000835F867|nr:phosphatidylglycerophosphatase A [Desulfolucanica intricata]
MVDLAALLTKRGVYLHEIAEVVHQLQKPFSPHLTLESCLEVVEGIIKKREVQYNVLTGLALDILAEENKLPDPLFQVILKDEPLYGVDEVLGLGIANIYGTIGTTSFGYLDKEKLGIIGKLNNNAINKINTFLDDLVAGIAAAGSAKIAHNIKETDK